mmetsp:Transcript_37660/g.106410  ORF Transcript_37660/g.106410 Transcript_37660/m.106410 type:complete len:237 (+) Transcript_37660:73-783(+)
MHAVRAALAASGADGPSSESVGSLLQMLSGTCTMDLHICSIGGVGSTFLSNFANRHGLTTNLLTDQDGLRHCPSPPRSAAGSAIRRGVYLFGNPLDSVASHFQRGRALHQATKTSGSCNLPEQPFRSLSEYLDRGEDLFGYTAHFHNWFREPVSYDVMCVRYERMFDHHNAEALLGFAFQERLHIVNLEQLVLEFCASARPRRNQLYDLQASTMYSELQAEIDGLPDCFLRRACLP